MSTVRFLAASLLLGLVPGPADSENTSLTRAVRLVEEDRLDEAEAILREVDRGDRNYWIVQYGLPARHWIAEEYLEIIRRRQRGDQSDILFGSPRFRFHLRGVRLSPEETDRIRSSFERMLTRVAEWAGEPEWQMPYHKSIFVEIAESFRSPSPARTLIFFWDRQDRSPRMEITTRVLAPEFLELILSHEMTHVVLPHTSRPLAEGIANLAAKELFPGRRLPVRRQVGAPDLKVWPIEEVLLYNVRSQGKFVRQEVNKARKVIRSGKPTSFPILMEAYDNGDTLVDLILKRWGREKLMSFYRSTNRDPQTFDMLEATSEQLAPIGELRSIWNEHTRRR